MQKDRVTLEEIMSPKAADRLRDRGGPLSSHFDALATHLYAGGYSPATVRGYLRLAAHFGGWLQRRRIAVRSISDDTAQRFLSQASSSSHRSRSALRHFLEVLRERGAVRRQPPRVPSGARAITRAYEDYLLQNRGLKNGTVVWHLMYVGGFLEFAGVRSVRDLQRLSVAHVRGFMALRAEHYTRGALKNVAKALRSFFRFLHVERELDSAGLVAAVPAIAEYKLAGLPKYLSEEQLERVLVSFDLSTPIGLRDRAIARCLADLGLRSIEVAALTIDAINWSSGTIHICATKGGRGSELPLPESVGRAIVAYLKHGRPRSSTRRVFVRHRGPVGDPLQPGSIGAVVKRAFRRTGVSVARNGAHALRHTTATRLLRAGAKMKDVADILRHRSIDTTAIYAKVDLARLQEVALPWPSANPT
jgi:integrase/recombinase XerD